MLNEPMIFEDIDLANALHKAKAWLVSTYDIYIPTYCLVSQEKFYETPVMWKVEIFYREEEE
jgi:5'(3')-deoxyribonucleotidase